MAIETLRPSAAGDEESIEDSTSGAGNHWQDVDEASADDDTTKVYQTAVGTNRDLYNLPASSGSGTISKITVFIRCQSTNGDTSADFKISIKSNSTVTDSATKTPPNTGWNNYSQEWALNPADSAAWQWSDIDSLQIGLIINSKTTSFYGTCTQVYVEVDYTPTPPPVPVTDGDLIGIGIIRKS